MLDGPAVKKRIILISNFLQQAAGLLSPPFEVPKSIPGSCLGD